MKKHLGFSDEQIIMIDQRELVNTVEDLPPAEYYENFSQATWNRLTPMATAIFQNFKNTGYANQILTIGVTECETDTFCYQLVLPWDLEL